jgi:hypothetical protein
VFPGHYAEYQVRVGDLLFIDFLTSFSLESIRTVAACFCDGTLVDLAYIAQDYVVLMI